MPRGTLSLDVETHSKDLLYSMPPEEYVRLCGYRWKGQETVITTNLDELREQILKARWITGHNITMFDLPAIFGVHSDIPLQLAMEGRVYCTFVHAVLVHPAPPEYVNRHGEPRKVAGPESMLPWFGLDEQAHQLGVQGKTHDLKALAREFAPIVEKPSANGRRIIQQPDIDAGYGLIPVDDPRYQDYLRGDVAASEEVARKLLEKGPLDDYALREQEIAARAFVISANGFRVDIDRATARRDELAERRDIVMSQLVEQYGFPTDGASPWASAQGKTAIMGILADAGVTPKSVTWPKTPLWEKRAEKLDESKAKAEELADNLGQWRKELDDPETKERRRATLGRWIERDSVKLGELRRQPLPPFFGLSLSGDTIKDLTKETDAEDTGSALAEMLGQRSLAQLTLDCLHPDGFVHPQITMLQRSGRWSVTEPGLTVWNSRGPGAIEKTYYIPDNEDEGLLEIDYNAADARGVAALSGDQLYADNYFGPGNDGHLVNAWAVWGKDVVGTDKHDKVTAGYRQQAKGMGHGKNYGEGPKKMAALLSLPLDITTKFCEEFDAMYKVVVGWQNRVRKLARQNGYVQNAWGRRMWVQPGREYTQGPALMGQSFTREVVCDALLRMPIPVLRRVKLYVHDALIFSVPKKDFEKWKKALVDIVQTTYEPSDGSVGIRMPMPAEGGDCGSNWLEAAHD